MVVVEAMVDAATNVAGAITSGDGDVEGTNAVASSDVLAANEVVDGVKLAAPGLTTSGITIVTAVTVGVPPVQVSTTTSWLPLHVPDPLAVVNPPPVTLVTAPLVQEPPVGNSTVTESVPLVAKAWVGVMTAV